MVVRVLTTDMEPHPPPTSSPRAVSIPYVFYLLLLRTRTERKKQKQPQIPRKELAISECWFPPFCELAYFSFREKSCHDKSIKGEGARLPGDMFVCVCVMETLGFFVLTDFPLPSRVEWDGIHTRSFVANVSMCRYICRAMNDKGGKFFLDES